VRKGEREEGNGRKKGKDGWMDVAAVLGRWKYVNTKALLLDNPHEISEGGKSLSITSSRRRM
jgi:hypothetical protein